jgi:hypothetical protein
MSNPLLEANWKSAAVESQAEQIGGQTPYLLSPADPFGFVLRTAVADVPVKLLLKTIRSVRNPVHYSAPNSEGLPTAVANSFDGDRAKMFREANYPLVRHQRIVS